MTTFTSYTNILPDPSNPIGVAGQSLSTANGGTVGSGFKNVNFTSTAPIMRDRTNSGRLITRAQIYHKWEIKIGYNPMTQAEFNIVNSFLISRQGTLKPFFVKLPQYGSVTNLATSETGLVGTTKIQTSTNSTPAIGSIFTITDSSNSNHSKAYMITAVETASDHNTVEGSLSGYTRRLHFTPGLQKTVSSGSTLELNNPLIKVILKSDKTSYSLDQNNLYNLSLQLEEVTT